MPRFFLKLAYDGTAYSGWQVQPGVSTVQQVLEKALRVVLPDVKSVVGCGRTDAGVHASQYYAHFDTDLPLPAELIYKLNAILPLDIAVHSCVEVAPAVHARFAAYRRSYEYHVHYHKDPFSNHYSTFLPQAPDLDAMNEACAALVGMHDFSAFSKGHTQTGTNMCQVYEAYWSAEPKGAIFRISANRFLRNMVRALVGTLLAIGQGKLEPRALPEIMKTGERSRAGKSMPPQGLFLTRIHYRSSDVPGER